MTIYSTSTEIQNKVNGMNIVAVDAARRLATMFMADPTVLNRNDEAGRLWGHACTDALSDAGIDLEDGPTLKTWLDTHGADVVSVAVSIVICAMKEQESNRKKGLFRKVAGVAAGVAIGAFFG